MKNEQISVKYSAIIGINDDYLLSYHLIIGTDEVSRAELATEDVELSMPLFPSSIDSADIVPELPFLPTMNKPITYTTRLEVLRYNFS